MTRPVLVRFLIFILSMFSASVRGDNLFYFLADLKCKEPDEAGACDQLSLSLLCAVQTTKGRRRNKTMEINSGAILGHCQL